MELLERLSYILTGLGSLAFVLIFWITIPIFFLIIPGGFLTLGYVCALKSWKIRGNKYVE